MIKTGVLIIAEKPPAGSDYTNWKVYRATTKTGDYSVINGDTGQAITDMTYYDTAGTSSHWYKVSYYTATGPVESSKSEPMQGMSETYTTVRKLEGLLQLATLTDTSSPTVQQVVELINRMEDKIDNATGHAWRTRYSGTKSGLDNTQKYEYYDIYFNYEYRSGIPIYLKHRSIKTLSADSGDVFEIWDGSNWIDWLSTYTEGRADDYWWDYEQGILYLKRRFGIKGPRRLRMKYRYGESVVNRDIEDIATKMIAIDFLAGDNRSVMVRGGGDDTTAISHSSKIDMWTKQIKDDLMRYREFQVLSTME